MKATTLFLSVLLSLGFMTTASAAIYVENLPENATETELIELFSEYGQVMKIELTENSATGFVHMGNFSAELEAVQSLNGRDLKGNQIKVSKARPRYFHHGVLVP